MPQLPAAAFAAIFIACFVVDLSGALVAATPAGEQLLQRGNIVRLVRGQLTSANPGEAASFE